MIEIVVIDCLYMRKYKIRNKINIPMINKGLSNPKKYVSV